MIEIRDSGGDVFLLRKKNGGLWLSGLGPRGGKRGEALLGQETVDRIAQEGFFGEDSNSFKQSGHPLSAKLYPGFMILEHPLDHCLLFYLFGPRGGWRHPLYIYDPQTLDDLARAISEHQSSS